MFGGAPPPPSAEEVRQQEAEAKATLNFALGTVMVLYISPFIVKYASALL